jgi:hypothetical protein
MMKNQVFRHGLVLFVLGTMAVMTTGCSSFPGIHPFQTDGCTLCPDGNWRDVCVQHDVAYWRGGTMGDRWRADVELYKGVRERTNFLWASVMFMSVRIGGFPYWPASWRWGFGWKYAKGYGQLTTEEVKQADDEFKLSDPHLIAPSPPVRAAKE